MQNKTEIGRSETNIKKIKVRRDERMELGMRKPRGEKRSLNSKSRVPRDQSRGSAEKN